MQLPLQHAITKTLTAAECKAQMELPLQSLVREIIDAATAHANALSIGYSNLIAQGKAWVLSRLAIEMNRMPAVGTTYTMTTWVESFNRHFSQRDFAITDSAGATLGHARTVWIAIDIATRRPADMSSLANLAAAVNTALSCPMEPLKRLRPEAAYDSSAPYTVQVSDIDSNRHLTTAHYVELAVNCLPLEAYDKAFPARFETAFMKECLFGECLAVDSTAEPVDNAPGATSLKVAVRTPDGSPAALSTMILSPRGDI